MLFKWRYFILKGMEPRKSPPPGLYSFTLQHVHPLCWSLRFNNPSVCMAFKQSLKDDVKPRHKIWLLKTEPFKAFKISSGTLLLWDGDSGEKAVMLWPNGTCRNVPLTAEVLAPLDELITTVVVLAHHAKVSGGKTCENDIWCETEKHDSNSSPSVMN